MKRFPRSLSFAVTPKSLKALADKLEASDVPPRPKSTIEARWRAVLISTPIDQLLSMRFHATWRRALPYLALPEEHDSVFTKARQLILHHNQAFRLSSLIMVAAHTLDVELIQSIRQHPQYPLRKPRWIDLFADVQSPAEPFIPLAQTLWNEGANLESGPNLADIPVGCKGYERLLLVMVATAPRKIVKREVSEWLDGIIKKRWVGKIVIGLLIQAYSILPMNDLGDYLITNWYKASKVYFNCTYKQRPGAWQVLPRQILDFVHKYELFLAISDFFDGFGYSERLNYWRGNLDSIQEVEDLPLDKAFMMKIGRRYIIEFREIGSACYSYSKDEWDSIRSNPNNSGKLNLKQADVMYGTHWLRHDSGWQNKFDSYLREHCL